MRKYGKFERMPDGTRAKPPKVKNVLLQTYFTSLLCMVLCVSMFFGTSYAWFTSEVNNVGNEIYIGTLKVGLYKGDTNLNGSDTKLFDGAIRWEPGYTALETIKVVNEGDLAFKYNLNFIDGTVTDSANTVYDATTLATVAKEFEVWVFNHQDKNYTYTKPDSYENISGANGWVPVGTLADVLNGKAVLENKIMETVRDNNADTPTNPGTTDGVATTDTYTIALHMKESATGEGLMGKKIVLNVKLVAYQMSKETGAFAGYDQLVMTPADLKEAMENGGNVTLLADVDLSKIQVEVPADKTVVLDLNGHKITGTVSDPVSLVTNNGNLTIKGNGRIAVTFTGTAGENKAVNAITNRGNLIVNDGEISNTGNGGNQIGYAIDNYSGATLTVNGGTITASGSNYYDGIRLYCGSDKDNVVTINGGTISTIWAQNPSDNKATEVKGTVNINDGTITTVYYENYTTVKVKVRDGLNIEPKPYYGSYSAEKYVVESWEDTVEGYKIFTMRTKDGTENAGVAESE